jgi:hypothetical protein
MNVDTCRAPFARPAMPIDIAAVAYHSSALKITRLIFFFANLARDVDFLALVDLDVLFFGIVAPANSLTPMSHLSRGHVRVTVAPKKSLTL